MSVELLGATPQMRDPTSKMPIAIRKIDFIGKKLYKRPKNS